MQGRDPRGHAGRRRATALACSLLGALLLCAAPAQAADLYELTPRGCVVDAFGPAPCATTASGLDVASEIAMSPDGTSLYVVAPGSLGLAHLRRAPVNGALTGVSCVSDLGGTCPTLTEGLGETADVIVSPDGADVYATGSIDHAVVHLERDPATGALTPAGCVDDVGGLAACASEVEGLEGAANLAISPDGATVYVRGGTDNAVVRLDRDAATGALTGAGCVKQTGGAAVCAQQTPGLQGLGELAVSPDGENVYAAGFTLDALVVLDRVPATGALSPVGCFADTGNAAGCAPGNVVAGLDGAFGVAVSPDGASVYATATADDAVLRFDRAPGTGALTPAGCVGDSGVGDCGQNQQGLDSPFDIAISPDGRHVYAVGVTDDAFAILDRDTTTGALTPGGCVADVDTGTAGCTGSAQGLDGARGVTVSGTGSSVYVASAFDDAVARFDRELAPVCGPASGATTAPDPVVVTLACADPNGDPMALLVVDAPTGGTLVGAPDPATREITYVPDSAFSGDDTFTYRATSDAKSSNTATATVSVAPAPPAAPPPADPPPAGAAPPPAAPAPAPAGPAPSPGPGSEPPPPVTGSSVNLLPTEGTVLVRIPGSTGFVRVTDPQSVPTGTIVDATKGVVILRGRTPDGTIETMRFFAGTFRVTQPSAAGSVVDARLIGGDLAGCPRASRGYRAWADEQRRFFGRRVPRGSAGPTGSIRPSGPLARDAAKKKRSPRRRGGRTRRLWGDGKGRFRTTGREAAATVRGTRWLTEDTCTTTRVTVRTGVVEVRDRATGATMLVRRGQRVSAPFTVATLRRIARGGPRAGRLTAKARAKVRAASRRR